MTEHYKINEEKVSIKQLQEKVDFENSLRNGSTLLFWYFSNPYLLRECELGGANGILLRVF